MASALQTLASPDEHLAFDRQAEFKHGYLDGEIVSMPGGNARHAPLPMRLAKAIANQLPPPCELYSANLRVRVNRDRLYAYPDLTVLCVPLQFRDDREDTVTNPPAIVEVLSPSTENYDLGISFPISECTAA